MRRITELFWPVTKAKLHRLVTWVGVGFAVLAVVLTWAGSLGLSTEGKLAATVGMLTTLLAGWQRARPKIDSTIEGLPIPAGEDEAVTSPQTPSAKEAGK